MGKLVLGLDYGTESGRALLVDLETGKEAACVVHPFPYGVIDDALPTSGAKLPPDWALQHPDDYLDVLRHAVPAALKQAGAAPEDVVGVGVDFTACTVLPTTAAGEPLCLLDRWKTNRTRG